MQRIDVGESRNSYVSRTAS